MQVSWLLGIASTAELGTELPQVPGLHQKTITGNFHQPGGKRNIYKFLYKLICPVYSPANSREIVWSTSYETIAKATTGI